MAGLCKPHAAAMLVKALREEIGPADSFSHARHGRRAGGGDSSTRPKRGSTLPTRAIASMSGGTSQPNLNTMVEGLRNTPREGSLDGAALDAISEYWREAREFYTPFESPVLAAGSDLYQHEMPGGQYTNLFQQAQALGLSSRWPEVCRLYADVQSTLRRHRQSDADLQGRRRHGAVPGGQRPDAARTSCKAIANWRFRGRCSICWAGEWARSKAAFPAMCATEFCGARSRWKAAPAKAFRRPTSPRHGQKSPRWSRDEPTRQDVVSYLMYPQVFEQFAEHQRQFSDVSVLPTPVFFHGMDSGRGNRRRHRAGQNADHQVPHGRRCPRRRHAQRVF